MAENVLKNGTYLDLNKFREENWEIVKDNKKIISRINPGHQSEPNKRFKSPREAFDNIHTKELFEFIASVANNRREMRNKYVKAPIAEFTVEEVIYTILIRNLLEDQKRNSKTRKRDLYPEAGGILGGLPFGVKRWEIINTSLVFTPGELKLLNDLLGELWTNNWNLDNIRKSAIDESVYSHKPRMRSRKRSDLTKEKSPTAFAKKNTFDYDIRQLIGLAPIPHIEGKPNGDGLLAYGICVKATGLSALMF